MRKLKIMEHMSLDGVIQNSEDGDGFAYSNWSGPYRTPAGAELVLAEYGEAFDLLLGRRTYDMWSGYWPNVTSGAMAERINRAKKFVATHRPESLEWGPVEGVGPDLAEGVRRLKATEGPTLVMSGSSTLTSVLLEAGLVDEVLLIVYPVLVGTGKRLFTEGTPAQTFELVRTQATPTGVVLMRYKVVGPFTAA